MPVVNEGELSFAFPNDWEVSRLEKWSFYRRHFQCVCAAKVVDMLALDRNKCLWTIEVKDYRRHRRTKTIDLAEEVARKARDSLSALVAAKVRANSPEESGFAMRALQCRSIRLVLHLEQPLKHSKLFPRAIEPANVALKLRQLVKAIDPHPLVLERSKMRGVEWEVA